MYRVIRFTFLFLALSFSIALSFSLAGESNSGSSPNKKREYVSNITVLTDNVPDYTNLERMAQSITGPWAKDDSKTDDEKFVQLWRWICYGEHETGNAIEGSVTVTDPIKAFTNYGYHHCAITTKFTTVVAAHLGYQVAEYDMPCLHTVGDVFYGGSGHMFDADFGFIFRKKDTRQIAGFMELNKAFNDGGGGGVNASTNPIFNPDSTNFYSPTCTYPLPVGFGNRNYALYFEGGIRTIHNEIQCIGTIEATRKATSADSGHQYVLNLKPFEMYTRYFDLIDTTSTYLTDGMTLVYHKYSSLHVSGNGKWELTPDFSLSDYLLCVDSQTNMERGVLSPLLHPVSTSTISEIVFRIDAANVITGGKITGIGTKGAEDSLAVFISTNGGSNWQKVWTGTNSAVQTLSVTLESEIDEKYNYLVKVVMNASSQKTDVGLDSLKIVTYTLLNSRTQPFLTAGTNRCLFDMGMQNAGDTFEPVEVIYSWNEYRFYGETLRSHTELIADSGRHEYFINIQGPRKPTMKYIRMNLKGYGSANTTYGYSDGDDVGKDYERPRYFHRYGWDLAYKKPYIYSVEPDVKTDNSKIYLTNGMSPNLSIDGSYPSSAFCAGFSENLNSTITIDLEKNENFQGVRIFQIIKDSLSRYADSIQISTSIDSINFTNRGSIYEEDVWNFPVNYLWPSRFDMPTVVNKRYSGIYWHHFPLAFNSTVNARYVRFKVFNQTPVYIANIQILDSLYSKLVLDEFDHGFSIVATPNNNYKPAIESDDKANYMHPLNNSSLSIGSINPFSGFAVINYNSSSLSKNAVLKISNIKGQIVKSIDLNSKSGHFVWNGTNKLNRGVTAGVYFVTLRDGEKSITKRLIKIN